MSLEKKLIDRECQKSALECELRTQKIHVCEVFLSEGKLTPIQFAQDPNRPIPVAANAKVTAAFPKTAAAHTSGVLTAAEKQIEGSRKRIAVLFSGGPAAGGHNVLCGMLATMAGKHTLLGVRQGPKGLIKGDLFEIETLDHVQNMGGFDYLGSDRTKIKTPDQFNQVRETVKKYRLDGIVIIGGDDSNTNAALLAEQLYGDCAVIGVPKTIDGDLQVGNLLPISFGFDTATKIYAELVGNILQDAPSSLKYWHFVKLMGRAASQVTLEVALQTHPPVTLISEEIQHLNMSLEDIITSISKTIVLRAANRLPYGVVLIPEGLIEFIPEFKQMIAELNDIVAEYNKDLEPLRTTQKLAFLEAKLSDHSGRLMAALPESIKNRLVLDRDSHGNLQVSHIPTEELLVEMVGIKIQEFKNHPDLFFGPGKIEIDAAGRDRVLHFKFNPVNHFFGYEGRCGLPTVFDASFTYNLGVVAASLVLDGKTGYMASLTALNSGGIPLAIPLTRLLSGERRNGHDEWVIQKALVNVNDPAFRYFAMRREIWAREAAFSSPGPRQFFGPTSTQLPLSVALNQGYDDIRFHIG